MYKSKLQELCQHRAWNLPEYTTAKQGLDHCPRFEATVTVNNLSFKTLNPCKSSKDAQNDAAKLAFDHFYTLPKSQQQSPPSRSSSSSYSSSIPASPGSSSANDLVSNLPTEGTLQLRIQETNQTPHINGTASVVKEDGIRGHSNGTASVGKEDRIRDIQHLYKNQLQNYAQKRNLSLPLYTCEREGPPHASHFKCKVTIDGQTYENPEFFSTLKEAEHTAAKFALLSLSTDGVQEDDSAFYKNLLQELAQKEGYLLPAYDTEKYGEAHTPAFVSTVEVGGEVFTGPEAKTKKQAEMSAAKVAYVMLKESKSSPSPSFPSFSSQGQEAREFSNCGLHPDVSAFPQPSFRPIAPEISASSRIPKEQAEHEGNVDVSSSSPVTFSGGNKDSMIEPPPEMSPKYRTRIIVRPRVPNMTFPVNSTVLPMSDDKWVAVRLGPPI